MQPDYRVHLTTISIKIAENSTSLSGRRVAANVEGLAFVAEFGKRQPGLLLNNEPKYRAFSKAHLRFVSRDSSRWLNEDEVALSVRRHNAKPNVELNRW